MNTYDLPVSPAHLKALEARKKMLDARPRDVKPQLPDDFARDASACDRLYAESNAYYSAATAAYLTGDVATGNLYDQFAQAYLALAQTCEVATWGFFDIVPE